MVDVVDRATRSRMMSGIRGRDTKPEITVRKFLHAQGLRFRIASKNLPGKPDIVLPKYRTVVFVHGCFWHGHLGCKYFAKPKTNAEFWREKINLNRARDRSVAKLLLEEGWRVAVIWECGIKDKRSMVRLLDSLCGFVRETNDHDNSRSGTTIPFKEFGQQAYSQRNKSK